jgi:acetyl esterase
MAGPGPEVAEVGDGTVPGPGGDIPIRVYRPAGAGPEPLPVTMWFHGGGWVLGSVDEHDGACRELANASGVLVVSVEYRLSPESPFPGPLDDCFAATRWVAEHAGEIGGDPARLAVAGDSAGGNLAAAVAVRARDEGGPALAFQLLVYPAVDAEMSYPSLVENGEGYVLTADSMRWFWGHYRGDADARDGYLSPLYAADLSGLPPAMVITAEFDPLRDEGEAYAKLLEQAGVPTVAKRYDGQIHGFFTLSGLFPAASTAVAEAAAALKGALAGIQSAG